MDIILLVILILGVASVIFLLTGKKDTGSSEKMSVLMERVSILGQQNTELRQVLDSKLSEAHRTTRESLDSNSRFMQGMHGQSVKQIQEITEKLSKLEATNQQIMGFSAQLQSLQDILKNPKQRGILGEYFLEETLKNVLPPDTFQMQYSLGKDDKGEKELIVDAVVFVKDKMVPIDSKFSLENYEKILQSKDDQEKLHLEKMFKQDLKNRIDETSKYIKPEKGTMDFAFMFIPSEAIYYDLLINKVGAVNIDTRSMIEYAFRDKHVIIVSPTSFLAYLQTVLQGLRAMQIEESAKEIRSNVEKLTKHILATDKFMQKLGSSLSTTVNHYNSTYKELGKVDKDVVKITNVEKSIEPVSLERPKLEEE